MGTRTSKPTAPPAIPPAAEAVNMFGPGQPQFIVGGRRCRCGGEMFLTGVGRRPDAASLTCVSCGTFGGWLPRDELKALTSGAPLMMVPGPFALLAGLMVRESSYSPIAIIPNAKRPILKNWEEQRVRMHTIAEIAHLTKQQPSAGLGVAGGFRGLVPVDVDTDNAEIRAAVCEALPKALVAKRGRRGATTFFRDPSGTIPARKFMKANGDMLVEILCSGQSVIPPTVHPETGKAYEWTTPYTLHNTPIDDLPAITGKHILALEKALEPWLRPPRAWKPKSTNGACKVSDARLEAYAQAALASEVEELAAVAKGSRNWQLFTAACRLGSFVHHGLLSESKVHEALLGACNHNGLIKDDGRRACENSLASGLFKAEGDELRTPEDRPRHSGRRRLNGNASFPGAEPPAADKDQTVLPPCSDEAIALQFAERHEHELRHVALWGKWLRFDGKVWRDDATLETFNYARALCRETANKTTKEAERKDTASGKKRAAVVSLAREDRRLAATADQWDTNAAELNTPAGIVDLNTFEMRPHAASAYMTKMTAVAPGGQCPRWLRFLNEVTSGDKLLQDYLQRLSGYSLTGETTEHALAFAYGLGANGKTTFIGTVAGILGDYHRTAPIEAFTAVKSDRHPTELAMLRGARLVTASETEQGRGWAESRIKALTGGDVISARFMRQDFFDYLPQFKLLICGNHKPSLRNVDEAIRRRLQLVPFTVTIEKDKRDPELMAKLKTEWPGILQWMLDGCAMWRENGLAPPEAVTKATDAYLQAQDVVMHWLEECCARSGTDTLKNLYASFKAWAERNGEHPRSSRWLSDKLETEFTFQRTKRGQEVAGLKVLY